MKATVPARSLAIALPGIALAETTAVQDLCRGMPATVDGVVGHITDDEFLLADDTGSILVYIGPNPMPVRAGDHIRVAGAVPEPAPTPACAMPSRCGPSRATAPPRPKHW
jgi:hypothetical protein